MSAAYIQMPISVLFIMEENTMNPDQTAPLRAVQSHLGYSICKIGFQYV